MDTDVKALSNDSRTMTTSWTQFFTKFQVDAKQATDTLRTGLQASITQMNTGLANAFSKSIVEGKSFGQAMRQVTGQILEQFISMCVNMALQWAESQLMMAILGKATQAASGITQVTSNAAVGASAAMASTSAIPIVGPGLAPAAGAAMFAGILGTYGPLASAAGGWERVPNDTLSMLHKNEQVLPASYAQGLRDLVSGGTSGGGITHMEPHFHVVIDAKSFFQQNQGHLVSTIKDAVGNRRT